MCDISKSLAEHGPVEKAAERLLAEKPGGPTELRSATMVAGAVKGSFHYLYRYATGGKGGSRVASFSSFPVNCICLGQSNKGNVPAD